MHLIIFKDVLPMFFTILIVFFEVVLFCWNIVVLLNEMATNA